MKPLTGQFITLIISLQFNVLLRKPVDTNGSKKNPKKHNREMKFVPLRELEEVGLHENFKESETDLFSALLGWIINKLGLESNKIG